MRTLRVFVLLELCYIMELYDFMPPNLSTIYFASCDVGVLLAEANEPTCQAKSHNANKMAASNNVFSEIVIYYIRS